MTEATTLHINATEKDALEKARRLARTICSERVRIKKNKKGWVIETNDQSGYARSLGAMVKGSRDYVLALTAKGVEE